MPSSVITSYSIHYTKLYDVRVDEQAFISLQMVSQRQCDRVATALEDLDVEIAITGYARTKTPVQAVNFRNHSEQPEEIAFVQCHQAYEATGLRYRFRNKVGVEQHRANIARNNFV